MIHCSKCKIDKNEDEFYSCHKGAKKGRCKVCTRAEAKAWKAANPERNKATNKKWNDNNYSKKRHRDLKEQYGITPDQYQSMFDSQNGSCKICSIHQDKLSKRLSIDHCHDTGKVRGLLCGNCNLMLGYAEDKVDLLQKGINYLSNL